jgi:hypothetical protein
MGYGHDNLNGSLEIKVPGSSPETRYLGVFLFYAFTAKSCKISHVGFGVSEGMYLVFRISLKIVCGFELSLQSDTSNGHFTWKPTYVSVNISSETR